MSDNTKNSPSDKRFVTPLQDIPWWRTSIGVEERETILHSLEHENISQGVVCAEMEQEICTSLNVPYAVVTTSGSVALLMSCMALGIGPGDEVIVPTRTFIATAHAPYILGAKIVLVDCLPDNPNVDPAEIERKITSRTKAIMPVHLNGRSCETAAILAIGKKHGIPIIEDAAQAIFSRTKDGYMGTFGDLGCFSFGMVKLLNTGQGGAVVTHREDLYSQLKAIRNHGVKDVISHEYLDVGCNFKFNDIQASMGLWQVRRGPEKVAHSNRIYKMWEAGVADLDFVEMVAVDVDNGECALWPEAITPYREKFMDYLADNGVQSRKFLPCLHTAPHLPTNEKFPNSERFNRMGMNLPGGPSQPLENVERAIEIVRAFKP